MCLIFIKNKFLDQKYYKDYFMAKNLFLNKKILLALLTRLDKKNLQIWKKKIVLKKIF